MNPSAGIAWLEIIEGEGIGLRFELASETVMIGRGSRCQIQLKDPKVSREHARIQFEDGQLVVTDQGSSNGLHVNGEFTRHAGLQDNDQLMLGDTTLLIHLSPDAIPTILDLERRPPGTSGEPPQQEVQAKPIEVHCANCGRPLALSEKFCGACGTRRPN